MYIVGWMIETTTHWNQLIDIVSCTCWHRLWHINRICISHTYRRFTRQRKTAQTAAPLGWAAPLCHCLLLSCVAENGGQPSPDKRLSAAESRRCMHYISKWHTSGDQSEHISYSPRKTSVSGIYVKGELGRAINSTTRVNLCLPVVISRRSRSILLLCNFLGTVWTSL